MRQVASTSLLLHRWAGILFGVPALLWYGSFLAMHFGESHFCGRVDRAYRVFRWVGQGVHTFDFPPLAEHPALRDLAVLLPALLGTALSVTGLWLGATYLLRAARRMSS